MQDCIFCKIIRGDIPSLKVYEDDAVFAMLDIAPVNKGHVLVLPKVHDGDLDAMPEDAVARLFAAVQRVARAVVAATGADGYNVAVNVGAAAGQVVMHTHVHVIPRFVGDGLVHWPKRQVSDVDMSDVAARIAAAMSR